MEMKITRYGHPYTVIGSYKIVKHTKDLIAVYEITEAGTRFVGLREEWSQAIEYAKSLEEQQ